MTIQDFYFQARALSDLAGIGKQVMLMLAGFIEACNEANDGKHLRITKSSSHQTDVLIHQLKLLFRIELRLSDQPDVNGNRRTPQGFLAGYFKSYDEDDPQETFLGVKYSFDANGSFRINPTTGTETLDMNKNSQSFFANRFLADVLTQVAARNLDIRPAE
jgi:hypothetical protein